MPDISIVMPLYNKAGYIERAVNSVLKQTCSNFELIIVNDGSTDDSVSIVERIEDDRISIISQKNKGVSAARNNGIRNAKADLVAFLDADDMWLPNMIDTLLDLQSKYPQAGAYGTSYRFSVDGEIKQRISTGFPDHPWEGIIPNYFYTLLNSKDYPSHISSTAIPKRVFDIIGFFPEGEKQGEDVDVFCRVAFFYPIALSSKVCLTYYCDTENSGSRAWHERYIYIQTVRNALKQGEVPLYMVEDAFEFASKHELGSAFRHYNQGEIELARKMAFLCKTKRFRKDKWHIIFLTYEHILPIKLVLMSARYIRDYFCAKKYQD